MFLSGTQSEIHAAVSVANVSIKPNYNVILTIKTIDIFRPRLSPLGSLSRLSLSSPPIPGLTTYHRTIVRGWCETWTSARRRTLRGDVTSSRRSTSRRMWTSMISRIRCQDRASRQEGWCRWPCPHCPRCPMPLRCILRSQAGRVLHSTVPPSPPSASWASPPPRTQQPFVTSWKTIKMELLTTPRGKPHPK